MNNMVLSRAPGTNLALYDRMLNICHERGREKEITKREKKYIRKIEREGSSLRSQNLTIVPHPEPAAPLLRYV
jgi:hypothetical protein